MDNERTDGRTDRCFTCAEFGGSWAFSRPWRVINRYQLVTVSLGFEAFLLLWGLSLEASDDSAPAHELIIHGPDGPEAQLIGGKFYGAV